MPEMLESSQKQKIITDLQTHKKDTGSSAVQIGLLTNRITALTKHLQLHKQDRHSRRGLLQLVGQRRRLLNYIKEHDLTKYQSLVKKLGLRR